MLRFICKRRKREESDGPSTLAAPVVPTFHSAIVPPADSAPILPSASLLPAEETPASMFLPSAIVPSPVSASVAEPMPASTIHRRDVYNLLSRYETLISLNIQTLVPKGNAYLKSGYVDLLQENILIKSVFPSKFCTFGGIKNLLEAHKNFVRAYNKLKLGIDEVNKELNKDKSRNIFPSSITEGMPKLFELSEARIKLNEEIEKAKKSVDYHKKLAATQVEGHDSYHHLDALMKYFVAHEEEQFDLHHKLSFQSRLKLSKGGIQYNIAYRFFKFLLIAAQNEDNFICERARVFIEDLGGPDSCRELMLQTKLSLDWFKKMEYGPASSPKFMAALNEADQLIKWYASNNGSIEPMSALDNQKKRKFECS